MKKKKYVWVGLAGVIFLLLLILLYKTSPNPLLRKEGTISSPYQGEVPESSRAEGSSSCVAGIETRAVRGGSMTGLIEEGAEIKILRGYYDCNEVKGGDIVVLDYAGNTNPIIKMVRGVPGDSFSVIPAQAGIQKNLDPRAPDETRGQASQSSPEDDNKNNRYQILINGQPLTNSANQPYLLDDQEAKMLQLYEKDYQGKIPPDTYLALGNIVSGSLDSTKFGLVGKGELLGKVD